MAISTIKRDEDENPTPAKNHIYVLGNLHPWNKTECFITIFSAMELFLLVNIATKSKCVPKTAMLASSFFRTIFRQKKKYVCTSPAGDKLTHSKPYRLLKKTMYSLKRSPRH